MRIYLDMDGVVVNLCQSLIDVYGMQCTLQDFTTWESPIEFTGLTPDEFWTPFRNPHFWANLEPHRWAAELVQYLEKWKPTIVSTPILGGADGKVLWIKKYLHKYYIEKRYFLGGHKELLAAPDVVLIDDNEDSCQKFVDAGGNAVLFPAPWNNLRGFGSHPVLYVKMAMEYLVLKEVNNGKEKGQIVEASCEDTDRLADEMAYGSVKLHSKT